MSRDLNAELVILHVADLDLFNEYDETLGHGHTRHLDLDGNHIVVKKEDEKEMRKLIEKYGQAEEHGD